MEVAHTQAIEARVSSNPQFLVIMTLAYIRRDIKMAVIIERVMSTARSLSVSTGSGTGAGVGDISKGRRATGEKETIVKTQQPEGRC